MHEINKPRVVVGNNQKAPNVSPKHLFICCDCVYSGNRGVHSYSEAVFIVYPSSGSSLSGRTGYYIVAFSPRRYTVKVTKFPNINIEYTNLRGAIRSITLTKIHKAELI